MELAPIIVSVYNRVEHFRKCIEALQQNRLASESELFVVSDAPKVVQHEQNIKLIREYAGHITGFRKVHLIFRSENYGAHRSVIEGIQDVLKTHDRYVFLEDDVSVSSNFIEYMNDCLAFYENDPRIFYICAFQLPFKMPRIIKDDVYLFPVFSPWGFASWRDRFEQVDLKAWDRYSEAILNEFLLKRFKKCGNYMLPILESDSKGTVVAADVRIQFHLLKNNLFCIFPKISKSINIGLDGSGEHCGFLLDGRNIPQLDTSARKMKLTPTLEYDSRVLTAYVNYQNAGLAKRMIRTLRYSGFMGFLKYYFLRLQICILNKVFQR